MKMKLINSPINQSINQLINVFVLLHNFDQVEKLDKLVTKMAGFEKRFMVTGQTYPRKVDYNILAGISGLGATIHKVCVILIII